MKFREKRQNDLPKFKSIGYPLTNYFCLAFLFGIIALMLTMPEMRMAVFILPIWIGAIYLGYRYKISH